MPSIGAGRTKKELAVKNTFVAWGLLLACTTGASAAVKGDEIDYRVGETTFRGYIATDDGIRGKRPGILVVHEWWGLNDYARRRARMLAELGYTALAVDMYGGGRTTTHPDDAGKFAGAIRQNLPEARARFLAALELLKKQPTVDPGKIAAIGYCFGGGVVLQMARAGVDLKGVVSFHGSLATDRPARPGEVKARVLVLNGESDPMTTPEQIAAFRREMEGAGVDYRFISYPGAKHSFTNPDADDYGRKYNLPLAYNAEADRESWQAMQDFFREIFR
jgi:dienelactone hydrolase